MFCDENNKQSNEAISTEVILTFLSNVLYS